MTNSHKLTPVKTLRSQARKHLEKGAVTAGYNADRPKVLKMLNEALATEIVACCGTAATISWRAAFMARAWALNFSCTPMKSKATLTCWPRASCSSAASPIFRPTA